MKRLISLIIVVTVVAVALAVAYLAFLRQTPATESYRPMATLMQTQMAQTATFIDWVNSSVRNRRSVLRASVVASGWSPKPTKATAASWCSTPKWRS